LLVRSQGQDTLDGKAECGSELRYKRIVAPSIVCLLRFGNLQIRRVGLAGKIRILIHIESNTSSRFQSGSAEETGPRSTRGLSNHRSSIQARNKRILGPVQIALN
jgi:hypothetical protein